MNFWYNASMEPGHEDREYQHDRRHMTDVMSASMEPGHEDREYPGIPSVGAGPRLRLNGARS